MIIHVAPDCKIQYGLHSKKKIKREEETPIHAHILRQTPYDQIALIVPRLMIVIVAVLMIVTIVDEKVCAFAPPIKKASVVL